MSAATPAAPATIAPDAYVAPTSYRLAPDDVLEIGVVDHPEADVAGLQVMPDGTISYPHIGVMKVAGLTTAQVQARITRFLNGNGDLRRAYYLNPEVIVYVRERQVRTVNVIGTGVTGAERAGGKIPLKPGWRVFDAIAAQGGVPTDRYEFYEAYLIRGITSGSAPQIIRLDLGAIYRLEPSANLELQPDDTIVVNSLDEERTAVEVIGEVAKPGPVLCPRNGSIAEVLGEVEPSSSALLSYAKIERAGQEIPVDLSRWFKDGKVDTDVALQPGDRLVIPQNTHYYYVYGAVARAGTQIYPDDHKLSLLSAWADAGGTTSGVDLKKVTIIRKATDGGSSTLIKVNLSKVLAGNIDQDVPIVPGDDIYFPATRNRQSFNGLNVIQYLGVIPDLFYLGRL